MRAREQTNEQNVAPAYIPTIISAALIAGEEREGVENGRRQEGGEKMKRGSRAKNTTERRVSERRGGGKRNEGGGGGDAVKGERTTVPGGRLADNMNLSLSLFS